MQVFVWYYIEDLSKSAPIQFSTASKSMSWVSRLNLGNGRNGLFFMAHALDDSLEKMFLPRGALLRLPSERLPSV